MSGVGPCGPLIFKTPPEGGGGGGDLTYLYQEEETEVDITSTTYVLLGNMRFENPEVGTWAIWFHCDARVRGSNVDCDIEFYRDGVALVPSQVELDPPDSSRWSGSLFKAEVDFDGEQDFEVRVKVNSGETATFRYRTLFAVKIAEVDDS